MHWAGRKFPKHFGPDHVAMAEAKFDKWGMWAVFFGRFIALLRIFAGPLAGVLKMPYWKFLIANVLGGIVWAGGTTALIYSVGVVAEVAQALLLARAGRRPAVRPRFLPPDEAPGEEGGRRPRGGGEPGRGDGRLTARPLPAARPVGRNC